METKELSEKKKRQLLYTQLGFVVLLPVAAILFIYNNPLGTFSAICLVIGAMGKWYAVCLLGVALGVAVAIFMRLIWKNRQLAILKVAMCIYGIPFVVWLFYGWIGIPVAMAAHGLTGRWEYLVMHFCFFLGWVVYLSLAAEPPKETVEILQIEP